MEDMRMRAAIILIELRGKLMDYPIGELLLLKEALDEALEIKGY